MEITETLISENEIRKKVAELAADISRDHKGREVIFIGLLKGAFVFISDLVREVTVPCEIDFMRPSSYGNSTKSSGAVRLLYDHEIDIQGKRVILVEDIVDSGLTLKFIKEELMLRKPESLQICSLLRKKLERQADIKVDYLGFEIEDEFVVGYGLDYAGKYRNLPYIGTIA